TKSVFGASSGEVFFYECEKCTIFYQWPLLTEELVEKFYKYEFENFMQKRNASNGINWQNAEKHIESNIGQKVARENWLSEFYDQFKNKHGIRLLEVGCSSGFMLDTPRYNYGFDVRGIEPSQI